MVVMDIIKVVDRNADVLIKTEKEDEEDLIFFRGRSIRIPWTLIDMHVAKLETSSDILFIYVD